MTHFEVESLPTSGDAWGYLHYPIMARQARTYGKEIIGMTGRFHRSWADFGGLKTQDQLDYECGTILAAGGRICVGDQLHPRGVLDPAVYRLMGKSFARVEALEPWLDGAEPAAEVAMLALGEAGQNAAPGVGALSPDVEGAAQMLLECRHPVRHRRWSRPTWRATPRSSCPTALCSTPPGRPGWRPTWPRAGGWCSAARPRSTRPPGSFQLAEIPVSYRGPAPTQPSYLRPDALLAGGSERRPLAADYDYVFYDQAHLVEPLPGAECLGEIKRALFNRTWEHFTSHQHAPVGESLDAPLVVRNGNVLYFAAPLFSAYRT